MYCSRFIKWLNNNNKIDQMPNKRAYLNLFGLHTIGAGLSISWATLPKSLSISFYKWKAPINDHEMPDNSFRTRIA